MDAFFAQVEQVRINLPPETPLVTVQWQGVIAVNYPARKFGITRFLSLKECLAKCPDLVSVHVPTLSKEDPVPRYREQNDYDQHKISLITYRKASAEIMKIIGSICKNIEAASIDEAFIDVTEMVEDKLSEMGIHANPKVDWSGILMIGDNPGITFDLDDMKLRIACDISTQIRSEIYDRLGYTSSCGIAHNKVENIDARKISIKYEQTKQANSDSKRLCFRLYEYHQI